VTAATFVAALDVDPALTDVELVELRGPSVEDRDR
jgi:hypothetical protein